MNDLPKEQTPIKVDYSFILNKKTGKMYKPKPKVETPKPPTPVVIESTFSKYKFIFRT